MLGSNTPLERIIPPIEQWTAEFISYYVNLPLLLKPKALTMWSGITHVNHVIINHPVPGNLYNTNLVFLVASASWEICWEKILRLPIQEYSKTFLFTEAKKIVQMFCADAEKDGAKLLETEIKDARSFVSEQFALDPESREWQRIDAVLAGAEAGLTSDP